MKNTTYEGELVDILNGDQFEKVTKTSKKNNILAIEDNMNKSLKSLLKNGEIDGDLFKKLKCTGSQPARLYGWAKVHKVNSPLRPVLSLPGSAYDRLNKWLTKFFDKVPGANIETSTEGMRQRLEQIALESDETISMDVKSLYTNVPVHEAIELACEALYASSNPPELQQPTFKKLMELAVTNVWFMSGSDCYIQRDGVAMGASLAVILANVWLKNYEAQIAVENPAPQPPSLPRQKNLGYRCGGCEKMVAKNSYAIQCSTCRSWFHRKCAVLTLAEIKSLPSQTIGYVGVSWKTRPPLRPLMRKSLDDTWTTYWGVPKYPTLNAFLRSATTCTQTWNSPLRPSKTTQCLFWTWKCAYWMGK